METKVWKKAGLEAGPSGPALFFDVVHRGYQSQTFSVVICMNFSFFFFHVPGKKIEIEG